MPSRGQAERRRLERAGLADARSTELQRVAAADLAVGRSRSPRARRPGVAFRAAAARRGRRRCRGSARSRTKRCSGVARRSESASTTTLHSVPRDAKSPASRISASARSRAIAAATSAATASARPARLRNGERLGERFRDAPPQRRSIGADHVHRERRQTAELVPERDVEGERPRRSRRAHRRASRRARAGRATRDGRSRRSDAASPPRAPPRRPRPIPSPPRTRPHRARRGRPRRRGGRRRSRRRPRAADRARRASARRAPRKPGSCADGFTSTGERSASGATIATKVGSGIAPASSVALVAKPSVRMPRVASSAAALPSSSRTRRVQRGARVRRESARQAFANRRRSRIRSRPAARRRAPSATANPVALHASSTSASAAWTSAALRSRSRRPASRRRSRARAYRGRAHGASISSAAIEQPRASAPGSRPITSKPSSMLRPRSAVWIAHDAAGVGEIDDGDDAERAGLRVVAALRDRRGARAPTAVRACDAGAARLAEHRVVEVRGRAPSCRTGSRCVRARRRARARCRA